MTRKSHTMRKALAVLLTVCMLFSAFGGSLSVLAEAPANTIPLDTQIPVEITESGMVVDFTFTPEVTDNYQFYSSGGYDTYGYILTANGSQLTWNDDGGYSNNFAISYPLEAGVTYTLRAKMHGSGTTGSFYVYLRQGTGSWSGYAGNYGSCWYGHFFAGTCDNVCYVCGKPDFARHVYDDNSDTDCNLCGAVRTFIQLGTETPIDLPTTNPSATFAFIPPTTDTYTFYPRNDIAAYSYWFDADGTLLTQSGDRGSITDTLQAGQLYYFVIENYSTDDERSYVYVQKYTDWKGYTGIKESCLVGHFYDDACDDVCNVCGAVRLSPLHVYEGDNIACTLCGAIRGLPTIYDSMIADVVIDTAGQPAEMAFTPLHSGTYAFTTAIPNRSCAVYGAILDQQGTVLAADETGDYGDYWLDNEYYYGYSFYTSYRLTAGVTYTLRTWYADPLRTGIYSVMVSSSDYTPDTESTVGQVGISGNFVYRLHDGEITITECSYWAKDVVTVPATIAGYPVTAIGNYAFQNCTNVTQVVLPDSITSIGNRAFYGCSALTAVNIPAGVTSMGSHAFSNCTVLTAITIPEGLGAIKEYAFYNCDSLTNITIPDSVTEIGYSAFNDCYQLSTVSIGKGVTYMGSYAFDYCRNLKDVYIADLAAWCNGDFYSYIFRYCQRLYVNGTLVTDLVIPEGVTSIGRYAFYYAPIRSVTIPDSVTEIGTYAFYHSTLTTAIIGNGVKVLPENLFYSCSQLTNLTLPVSITDVNNSAFYGCNNLTDVWYNGSLEQRNLIYVRSGNDLLPLANWHFIACDTHTYSGACDDTCNGCDWVRTAQPHTYDHAEDAICNGCGYVRKVLLDGTPCFTVDSTNAMPGQTITVAVRIKNNPGLTSLNLRVHYDSSVLSLTNIKGQDFSGAVLGYTYHNPVGINWIDPASGNNINDGVLAVLTFRVLNTARAGDSIIHVTYDADDVFNADMNSVTMATVDGVVSIETDPHGDANGDGVVNLQDLVQLQRYLAGWDVAIDRDMCDVNNDGKVNNRDLVLIQRYLNGWDIKLI